MTPSRDQLVDYYVTSMKMDPAEAASTADAYLAQKKPEPKAAPKTTAKAPGLPAKSAPATPGAAPSVTSRIAPSPTGPLSFTLEDYIGGPDEFRAAEAEIAKQHPSWALNRVAGPRTNSFAVNPPARSMEPKAGAVYGSVVPEAPVPRTVNPPAALPSHQGHVMPEAATYLSPEKWEALAPKQRSPEAAKAADAIRAYNAKAKDPVKDFEGLPDADVIKVASKLTGS